METIKKQATMWTLALITLMTMFSCDEDWWNDWDGRSDITGQWRIVETTGYSPYRQDDCWRFYKNGDFDTYGYGTQPEYGLWSMAGRRNIQISFDNGRTVSMDAYVRTFSDDYMTLNVDDYDSRTSYTLRFVRTGGYDW
ncbi:MAG: hypothetical protein JNG43_03630 [Prevotellamassilia sp.]|jgi:hypothetical protein|nr:hypothetical protein [Prevotellamassilia sp.]